MTGHRALFPGERAGRLRQKTGLRSLRTRPGNGRSGTAGDMQNKAKPDERGLRDAVAAFPIFAGLEPATLDRLAAVGRQRSWTAGTLLFQRGDRGDHMICLTRGRVRLSIGNAQGRELVIAHLTAGDVLGELALLDGLPRSADAQVLDAATGIVIGREDFTTLARTRPDLSLALARHLSEMLRNTNYQMESIALFDLRQRVVRFFLFSLRQIHGERLPDRGTIRSMLNQSDLSAVLCASRPKVNRVLQDLLAEGALTREGGALVCDVRKLAQIAGDDEADGGEGWP